MAAVVRWADVVADPSRFAGRWDFSLGEDLLAVDRAFERATGEPAPPVSVDGPRDQTQALLLLPRQAWLHVFPAEHLGTRRLKLPKAYKGSLLHLQQLLNSDPSWWDWWEKTRGGPSQLICHIGYHDQDQVRSSLRRGRDFAGEGKVTVQVVVPLLPAGSSHPSGEDDADQVRLAREHLNLLLDVVRKKLEGRNRRACSIRTLTAWRLHAATSSALRIEPSTGPGPTPMADPLADPRGPEHGRGRLACGATTSGRPAGAEHDRGRPVVRTTTSGRPSCEYDLVAERQCGARAVGRPSCGARPVDDPVVRSTTSVDDRRAEHEPVDDPRRGEHDQWTTVVRTHDRWTDPRAEHVSGRPSCGARQWATLVRDARKPSEPTSQSAGGGSR